MALNMDTLAAAKKYTKDSVAGAGAVAGKPCQIQSITDITGGKRVTFLWVDNNGTSHTSTMDVMNGTKGDTGATGADGQDGAPGLGIKSVSINVSNHLIITYDDDSTEDAGEIPGAGSLTSLSDTNISNPSNDQILKYNAATGKWENGNGGSATIDELGDIADVNLNNLTDGQIIKWDSSSSKWINASLSIPSKTSDLTNDSNFVSDNDYVHTDNNYDDTAKTAVDGLSTVLNDKVDKSSVGTSGGVAELDNNGKVPSSQLPSYVDNVKEGYYKEADGKFYEESTYETEIPGEADKIYISVDTDIQYRWTGSAFSALGGALQLGETSSTAYRGDRGKTAYDFSQSPYESNPAMNGHASAGSSNSWSRGDHIHPSDSTKQDVMQVNSMPVPGAGYVGKNILQYKGTTTAQYTRGYFYECVTDGTTYEWQEVQVQEEPEDVYSTDERVVGTWIDGKPIYRKVVEFGALPNATSKDVAHGISNLDYIVSINTTAKYNTNYISIPYVDEKTLATSISISIRNTKIRILSGADQSMYTATVVIEYTKTTD